MTNPLSTLSRLFLVSIKHVKFQVAPCLLHGITVWARQLDPKMEFNVEEHGGALLTRFPADFANIPLLTGIVFVNRHVGFNFFRNFFIFQTRNCFHIFQIWTLWFALLVSPSFSLSFLWPADFTPTWPFLCFLLLVFILTCVISSLVHLQHPGADKVLFTERTTDVDIQMSLYVNFHFSSGIATFIGGFEVTLVTLEILNI